VRQSNEEVAPLLVSVLVCQLIMSCYKFIKETPPLPNQLICFFLLIPLHVIIISLMKLEYYIIFNKARANYVGISTLTVTFYNNKNIIPFILERNKNIIPYSFFLSYTTKILK